MALALVLLFPLYMKTNANLWSLNVAQDSVKCMILLQSAEIVSKCEHSWNMKIVSQTEKQSSLR